MIKVAASPTPQPPPVKGGGAAHNFLSRSTIVFLLFVLTGSALATDLITLKSGMIFEHQLHKREVGVCTYCHEGTPGKIPGFGKEFAHKFCIGCHIDFKEGPQDCQGCHQPHKKKD